MAITRPLTTYFSDRNFRPVTAETPFADLLNRSAAFGNGGDVVRPEDRPNWDLAIETDSWAPRDLTPSDLVAEPARYVDGAARATLLGWGLEQDGGFAVLVGGVIGAMAGRIENRQIVPEPELVPGQHGMLAVGMAHSGFPAADIEELRHALEAGGIEFLDTSLGEMPLDQLGGIEKARVAAHSQVTGAMNKLERLAIGGPEGSPPCFTIVDGNLGSHTTDDQRQVWPFAGVVKRHHMTELPDRVALCALKLRVGQRTPLMEIKSPGNNRPPMLTWYLKIRGDYGTAMNGVIRVEAPTHYVHDAYGDVRATEWADSLSRRLLEARATRGTYSREDCSLQPVLLIEDRLHAKAGDMETIRHRLTRLLGLPRAV